MSLLGWPWWRPGTVENRDSARLESRNAPYTDAITTAIIAAAGTADAASDVTASALEVAAGVYARAMASATVDGATIPPALLAAIIRDMVTVGEAVVIEQDDVLMRASGWEVAGQSPSPAQWLYRVTVPVPDGEISVRRTGDAVAHCRYSTDRERPWIGVPPFGRAVHVGALLARLEQSLSVESGTAVGYLLPIPTDGQDETVESLRDDIRNLNGRTAIVETTSGGWGEGRTAAPAADWRPQRIGPDMPDALGSIHDKVTAAVLATLGVPVELVHPADGTGQREAWRRFLHGSLAPLAAVIAWELSGLIGRRVRFSFESLFASDIAGRARAFQSLVGGGMDIEQAAALSGLIMEGDA